MKKVIALAGSK